MMSADHDRELANAFDAQAEKFERAPVQSDPVALANLVRFADFQSDSIVLDAGCGPGLVGLALLEAGLRVVGVDLSEDMIARARKRCAAFGDRAQFIRVSLFEHKPDRLYDGSISRFTLHHAIDPLAFVKRQVELVRPGGVVVACDHTSDPNRELARIQNEIEIARDFSHVKELSPGELVDLFAAAGLDSIRFVEESFSLDFDEWFDRATPSKTKEETRSALLSAGPIRGFDAKLLNDGSIRIECHRGLVRGVKPVPK
jgi:SAM-dependent methyltransferase